MSRVRLVDADPTCDEHWLIGANSVGLTRHTGTSSQRSGSSASWQSSFNRQNLPESPSTLGRQKVHTIWSFRRSWGKKRRSEIEPAMLATRLLSVMASFV